MLFRIPSFYEVDLEWDVAVNIMTGYGRGDLLEGMKALNRVWDEHCANPEGDDEELFERWYYEFNAYNVVYEGMAELFAPAEVA